MENLMKRLFLALFFMALCNSLNAQIQFYKVYSGNGYDRAYGVAELPDSGYLVTGASSSFEEGPSQTFLMRLDKYGEFVWSRAYGGPEFEEGRRVMALPGYGYYLAGTSSSGPSTDFDMHLIFTDENGAFQWEKFADNTGWERVHDAILMPDTSLVLVGETSGTSDENRDMLAIRFDKTGNEIWRQQWGTDEDDQLNAVYAVSDTTFLLAGMVYNQDSLQNKGYLAKMHIDGSIVWDKELGVEGNYSLNDVTLSGGTIKAVGHRVKTGYSDYDIYFAILDVTGSLLYAEEHHSDYDSRLTNITQVKASSYNYHVMSEQTINPGILTFTDAEDAYLSLFDQGLFWAGIGTNYSGTGLDEIGDIKPTYDSLAVAVGFHSTIGPGGNSAFIVKIGYWTLFPMYSSGTLDNIVSTDNFEVLNTLQVFPNPMEDALIVSLPETAFAYELYDASGRLLVSGSEWSHTQIDVSSQPHGAYLLRISHESGETAVLKLVK